MDWPRSRYFDEKLEVAARELASALNRWRVDEGLVRRLLDELDQLPAAAVPTIEQTLPQVLGLGWRPEPGMFDRLSGARSERELLAVAPELAWILLFHRNGYLREAALRALPGPPSSPFRLASLIYRLNDWVEPVRDAAAAAALRSFAATEPALFADVALYVLPRRFDWRRWDRPEVLDAAFDRPEVSEAVAELVASSRPGPLAKLLRTALRFPSMEAHLATLSMTAAQPTVRALAFQALASGHVAWPEGYEYAWIDKSMGKRRRQARLVTRPLSRPPAPEMIIRQGLADRSAFVRKQAVSALIASPRLLPAFEDELPRLAADRSPAVRERVDFIRRRRDDLIGLDEAGRA